MDHNNPKRSKALIIALIVVILLLVGVYFLFRGSGGVFGTKPTGSVGGKIFAPLLGTSKQKDLSTVSNSSGTKATGTAGDTAGTATAGTAGDTSSDGGSGSFSATGGDTANGGYGASTANGGTAGFGIVPTFNPLPTPGASTSGGPSSTTTQTGCKNIQGKTIPCPTGTTGGGTATTGGTPQCSDAQDNDGDGFADKDDAECHTDQNANNISSYEPTLNNEAGSSGTTGGGGTGGTTTASLSICPEDDPLVFTADESVQLNDLLRQYYLIAPALKTDDDMNAINRDIAQNRLLIQQANDLTQDCKDQKLDPMYTGPQTIRNNPYYADINNTTDTYLPGESSAWIAGSPYYQSGYGASTTTTTVNPGIFFGGLFGGQGPVTITTTWPDAYRGVKVINYPDFEKMFKVW